MPHRDRPSRRGAARGAGRSARRHSGRVASPAAGRNAPSLSQDTEPPEQTLPDISNTPARATRTEFTTPLTASTLAARSASARNLDVVARMTHLIITPSPPPPLPIGQSHSGIEASATMQPSDENYPRSLSPGTRQSQTEIQQSQTETHPERRGTTAAPSVATSSASPSWSSTPVLAQQSGTTAAAAQSTEATDLIEAIANHQATREQYQSFGSRVQSDTGFLRQITERESLYRSRRTGLDYHRAMSLRIAVRDYAGRVMELSNFERDDELVRVVEDINRVIEIGPDLERLGLSITGREDGFTPDHTRMFPALTSLPGNRLAPDGRPTWDPFPPQTEGEARRGGARASSAPAAAAGAARSSAAPTDVPESSSSPPSSLRPENSRAPRPSTSPVTPKGSRTTGSAFSFSPRPQGGGRAGSSSTSSPRPEVSRIGSPAASSTSSPRPGSSSRATAGGASSVTTSSPPRESGGRQAGPSRSGSDELWKGIFRRR